MLFNDDYVRYITPILLIANDKFCPPEISDKIRVIHPESFKSKPDKLNDKDYAKIKIDFGKGEYDIERQIFATILEGQWGSLYNDKEDLTVKKFLNEWTDIVETSISWINSKTSYQKLNNSFLRAYKRARGN